MYGLYYFAVRNVMNIDDTFKLPLKIQLNKGKKGVTVI